MLSRLLRTMLVDDPKVFMGRMILLGSCIAFSLSALLMAMLNGPILPIVILALIALASHFLWERVHNWLSD